MSRILKPNSPIAQEVRELVQPTTHKEYYLWGKEITEPKKPWQSELEGKLQSCTTYTSEPLKEIESKISVDSKNSSSPVKDYIFLIKELGSAFCTWSAIKDHLQKNQSVKGQRAQDAQSLTISDYLKALEASYKNIPEADRATLPTPQEIRARLFPKKK